MKKDKYGNNILISSYLKFAGKVYQWTNGYICLPGRILAKAWVCENWDKLYKRYKYDLYFGADIELGMWDIHYGFFSRMKRRYKK